jgi:hypothetical protein
VEKYFFQEFSDKVISANPSIRFVGIADEHGRLLATKDRKGLNLMPRYKISSSN